MRPLAARLLVVPLVGIVLMGCSGGPSSSSAGPGPGPTAPPAGTTAAAPGPTPTASRAAPATPSASGKPVPPPVATSPPADPLAPGPGIESAPSTGQPTCLASAVTVVDADAVGSAGGGLVEVFALRTSGRPCQLDGFPALRFLGADGRLVPVRVDRGGHGLPATRPGPVALSRSTSASFELALPSGSSCRATVRAIVRLPGTTVAVATRTSVRLCSDAVGVSRILRRVDQESAKD